MQRKLSDMWIQSHGAAYIVGGCAGQVDGCSVALILYQNIKTKNTIKIQTDRSQSSTSVLKSAHGKAVTVDCSPVRILLGPATKQNMCIQ